MTRAKPQFMTITATAKPWVFACVAAIISSATQADSVFVGGLPYDNVQVLDVIENELVFTNAQGVEIKQPMIKVDQIHLDKFPGLENAERHAKDEAYDKAVKALAGVSRPPVWLKHWIDYRLTEIADKAGDANAATRAYVELARSDQAFEFYLSTPPLESLSKADDRVKKRLSPSLSELLKAMDKEHKAYADVKKMVALVGGDSAEAKAVQAEVEAAKNSAIEMTTFAPASNPVTKMLQLGRFTEAREQLLKEIKSRNDGDSARRLYQLGLAQRGLADKAEGEDARKLHMSAALSFMRVVIHFSPQSRYRGPALLEAGYAMIQIDRSDKAVPLLTEAGELLKPEDTVLRERLMMLQKKLEGVN